MKARKALRKLVASLGAAALITLSIPALSGPSAVGCLFGGASCGTSSNQCRADCSGGVFCVPSGDPFEMCQCEQGACSTVECKVQQ